MIDQANDFEQITKSLARGKSLVRESMDLTRKNVESKKEIERRLKNCLTFEKSLKNTESFFTLELESNQLSIMPKEKSFDANPEIIINPSPREKALKDKIDELSKQNIDNQKKLEEAQHLIASLKEENYAIKSNYNLLSVQLQSLNFYKSHISSLEQELKYIQTDKENLIVKNQSLLNLIQQLQDENLTLKIQFREYTKKFDSTPNDIKSFDSPKNKRAFFNENFEDPQLTRTLSSENCLAYFNTLGNKDFFNRKTPSTCKEQQETPKSSLTECDIKNYTLSPKSSLTDNGKYDTKNYTLSPKSCLTDNGKYDTKNYTLSPKSSCYNERIKNEDIVEKLEEKYHETNEKFKKLSTHLANHKKSESKISMSFDNIEYEKEIVCKKPKIFIKVKKKKNSGSKLKKYKKK
ncbi:hypothetical protein SteCoe_35605 [Stentor coeruleus]|uniref:Uncharacterized protein n=1 Tax=Stentor coeruleus TaxID=5963 RepID=A0A1R2AS01_9CILI|nr:hypothetical protein SteCoe_35605 [Stentor coeruleus]